MMEHGGLKLETAASHAGEVYPMHEEPTETKNTFGYRDIYSQGVHVYAWQVVLDGETLTGSSSSIRKAYREARREVRRYRKMEKFLNK